MFKDRSDAGRRLVPLLAHLATRDDVVVVGLPRGGVPVAREVALALRAPLDVILVRKLGLPSQPEVAMGAIGENGVRVLDQRTVRQAGVSDHDLETVEARERLELGRRVERYRGGRTQEPLRDRTVVVVDDGLATGSTARAACQVARAQEAEHVILAVPVAPEGWVDRLSDVADEYVCGWTPSGFFGVGQFYRDFSQTTDEQVVACLDSVGNQPLSE